MAGRLSGVVDEPRATAASLVDKATYYDAVAARRHVHPDLQWIQGVVLKEGVDPETATWSDVERWLSGENDGLWSALYLAAQAYRYAVTQDEAALEMVRRLLEGESDRMAVTGVPGMFTRQFVPPGIDGLACPEDDAAYTTDEEKDDNRWVQIRDDGCAWVVARETGEWTRTDHCGHDAFAGYCWLDNVSKDEYAGHMFALGAVLRLVPVDDVQANVKALLRQIGDHLVANDLRIVDWDGRVTEHGRFHPLALDNFPGFNAAMSLSYLALVRAAVEDPELDAFYDRCLLMRDGRTDCFDTGRVQVEPFQRYLDDPGLFLGDEGCLANYNNMSMHALSMHLLVDFTRDPSLRGLFQASLRDDIMATAGEPRAALNQNNALFDIIWAANKPLGPGTDGPAYDAVENAVCMLKQFRARQDVVEVSVDPRLEQPYCLDRFGRDTSDIARTPADRCTSNFMWWKDPYDLRPCAARARTFEVPTDYLLAYWMARYYGFVSETL